MSGHVTARTAEDVDDMVMTAAQVKAIATGNPQILEKVSAEIELSRLYTVWRNSRRDLKWELQSFPRRVQEAGLRVASHDRAVAVRDRHSCEIFHHRTQAYAQKRSMDELRKKAQAGDHLKPGFFTSIRAP